MKTTYDKYSGFEILNGKMTQITANFKAWVFIEKLQNLKRVMRIIKIQKLCFRLI